MLQARRPEPLKEKILIPSQEAAGDEAMVVEGTVLSAPELPKDTAGESAAANSPVASPRPEPVRTPRLKPPPPRSSCSGRLR